MDVREKLIEICFREFCDLAGDSPCGCDGCPYGKYSSENGECYEEYKRDKFGKMEKTGVTVQKSSCPYCCDNGEGHGMLKHSYDDEDGMEMSIHPSTRKENGYQSQAWWATVHFRGECRDFYIEVCPFCGRRLVPLKEERETAMPHLPKETARAITSVSRRK